MQPSWRESTEKQRDAMTTAVRLLLKNPSIGPAAQHDLWVAKRLADGWSYGENIDSERKTHPYLVPYEQLSIIQRTKDELFQAVVFSSRSD